MQLKHLLKKINQQGFGLVEVIAALSISVIVLTSLVSLALFTVRASLQGKILLESSKMASRELERVRSYRDQSSTWAQFLADLKNGTGQDCTGANAKCYMVDGTNVPQVGSVTENIDSTDITRYFNIVPDSNDPNNIVKVSVYVDWKLGAAVQNTHIYTNLSNWEPK